MILTKLVMVEGRGRLVFRQEFELASTVAPCGFRGLIGNSCPHPCINIASQDNSIDVLTASRVAMGFGLRPVIITWKKCNKR